TGPMSIDNDWLARSGGAVLVICVTVQQQAARNEASGAGAFLARSCVLVGQQQELRVVPSYMQRYQDAVATDGARTRTSRIRAMRRTRCCHLTRVAGACNAGYGRRVAIEIPSPEAVNAFFAREF